MEVSTTRYKSCDLVKAVGRIDSNTAPKLAEVMEELTNDGHHKIVFNMEGVEYMSSAGLRVLIGTQKECKKHRGEIALAMVPKRIYEAMDLAGFITLFSFYDDVTTAVGNI